MTAARQRRAPVKDADVVQPQESSLKHVLSEAVFAVHPPGEVQHQLSKSPLEKVQVAFSVESLPGPVEEDRRPGVHRRIDIAEVPFVGRNLPARMQEEVPQQQVELF